MVPGRIGRFVQKPIALFLSKDRVRKAMWVVAVILAFLVFESWQEMKHREREDKGFHDKKHQDMAQALLMKSMMFRSQRNFYLTFFTFALFLIMFRMKFMTARIYALEDSVAEKAASSSKSKKDD